MIAGGRCIDEELASLGHAATVVATRVDAPATAVLKSARPRDDGLSGEGRGDGAVAGLLRVGRRAVDAKFGRQQNRLAATSRQRTAVGPERGRIRDGGICAGPHVQNQRILAGLECRDRVRARDLHEIRLAGRDASQRRRDSRAVRAARGGCFHRARAIQNLDFWVQQAEPLTDHSRFQCGGRAGWRHEFEEVQIRRRRQIQPVDHRRFGGRVDR